MPPQQRRQHQVLTIRTMSRMLLGFAFGFVRCFFVDKQYVGSMLEEFYAASKAFARFEVPLSDLHRSHVAGGLAMYSRATFRGWVGHSNVRNCGVGSTKGSTQKTWKLSGFQLSSFQRSKRHATAQISMASCAIPV